MAITDIAEDELYKQGKKSLHRKTYINIAIQFLRYKCIFTLLLRK